MYPNYPRTDVAAPHSRMSRISDAVYFHGGQHVLPFAVLAVWATTWLGLMLVVSRRRETSPDTLRPRAGHEAIVASADGPR